MEGKLDQLGASWAVSFLYYFVWLLDRIMDIHEAEAIWNHSGSQLSNICGQITFSQCLTNITLFQWLKFCL